MYLLYLQIVTGSRGRDRERRPETTAASQKPAKKARNQKNLVRHSKNVPAVSISNRGLSAVRVEPLQAPKRSALKDARRAATSTTRATANPTNLRTTGATSQASVQKKSTATHATPSSQEYSPKREDPSDSHSEEEEDEDEGSGSDDSQAEEAGSGSEESDMPDSDPNEQTQGRNYRVGKRWMESNPLFY